jgi:hypothetical protein
MHHIGEKSRPCLKLRPDQFQRYRSGNQKNDDPFQDLQAAIGGLIGNFFVDTFEGLKLSQNAPVPFVKVKSSLDQGVYPRQILVTE